MLFKKRRQKSLKNTVNMYYVLVYTYKKIVFLIFSVCMYIYTQEDGASISFSCYSILFRRRRGRKRCPPILLQEYLSLFALCIHT